MVAMEVALAWAVALVLAAASLEAAALVEVLVDFLVEVGEVATL